MTTLAAPRVNGSQRIIRRDFRPMAANAKIWPGALVMVLTSGGNSGYYQQAQAGTGHASGIATGKGGTATSIQGGGLPTGTSPTLTGASAIDNTGGANGALYAEIEYPNPFWVRLFRNDTVAPVLVGDRGNLCYCLDDQTVTHTATSNAPAGEVYDVTTEGVWVKLGGTAGVA